MKTKTTKMMNKLNVFKYGYLPWRYIPNWGHNIGQFFRNWKYAWQRATKGCSDWDTWDLDIFYLPLIEQSLRDYRSYHRGCPNELTDGQWNDILDEMIDHFQKAQTDGLLDNPFADEYIKMIKKYCHKVHEDGREYWTTDTPTGEDKILYDNYHYMIERGEGIARDNYNKGMEMLIKWLPHLWW